MKPPRHPRPSKGGDDVDDAASTTTGGLEKIPTTTTRQSYSCAECRRLKLKCSRTWPCTSCEKRGCSQICPNGHLKTGKGKRLILADTEELHERISALEVALAKSHAANSTQPHPLLAETYNYAPLSEDVDKKPAAVPRAEDEKDAVDSAFGRLIIGQGGHSRFVGSFAGSEYLRTRAGDVDELSDDQTPPAGVGVPLSSVPLAASGLRVQPGVNVDDLRRELPDWFGEGEALVKHYWDNVGWMYNPIPRPLFESDFLTHVYDFDKEVDAHKLACVFLVMALGVMFDLTRLPFDPRREQLFAIGQACLGAVGLERSSPATIRALHLCGTYILNDKHGSGGEIFWPICGAAIKVAYSLGLHRDGTMFGLSEEETEDRRLIWWELVLYDRLQAMCFARPAGVTNKYTDTKLPQNMGMLADPDEFHISKLRLAVLMEKVIDVQTSVASVPYSLVTQLDAELEDFKNNIPEPLAPGVSIQDLPLPFDASIPPHQVIHRFGIRLLVAQSRLLLSRAFFTRAISENPSDPSFCKHGSSFVTLYESAQEIVFLVKQLVIYHPGLIARWWFFWFHAYSSACCLAAIVINAPVSAFASPAFTGLSTVCDIAKAAREGCRAKKGLPVLLRLRYRAEQSLRSNNRMGDISSSRQAKRAFGSEQGPAPGSHGGEGEGEGEDDLSHLDGTGKLLRMPVSHQRTRSSTLGSSSTSAPQVTPPSTATGMEFISPKSSTSAATASTLVERTWEGVVPPLPLSLDGMGYFPTSTGGYPLTPITASNASSTQQQQQQQQHMQSQSQQQQQRHQQIHHPSISPSISTAPWSSQHSDPASYPRGSQQTLGQLNSPPLNMNDGMWNGYDSIAGSGMQGQGQGQGHGLGHDGGMGSGAGDLLNFGDFYGGNTGWPFEIDSDMSAALGFSLDGEMMSHMAQMGQMGQMGQMQMGEAGAGASVGGSGGEGGSGNDPFDGSSGRRQQGGSGGNGNGTGTGHGNGGSGTSTNGNEESGANGQGHGGGHWSAMLRGTLY